MRNAVFRFSIAKIITGLLAAAILGMMAACTEGTFELAKESRLPKWFDLPQGATRDEVTVTLDTYLLPTEKSVFTLKGKGGVTVSVVTAHRLGGYDQPKQLRNPPSGYPVGYPSYEVLTSGGKVDVFEFRRMEPIFYTSDDVSVWKELAPENGR
jgi:hypothetical protein